MNPVIIVSELRKIKEAEAYEVIERAENLMRHIVQMLIPHLPDVVKPQEILILEHRNPTNFHSGFRGLKILSNTEQLPETWDVRKVLFLLESGEFLYAEDWQTKGVPAGGRSYFFDLFPTSEDSWQRFSTLDVIKGIRDALAESVNSKNKLRADLSLLKKKLERALTVLE